MFISLIKSTLVNLSKKQNKTEMLLLGRGAGRGFIVHLTEPKENYMSNQPVRGQKLAVIGASPPQPPTPQN